jgi:hypothetical protein
LPLPYVRLAKVRTQERKRKQELIYGGAVHAWVTKIGYHGGDVVQCEREVNELSGCVQRNEPTYRSKREFGTPPRPGAKQGK